RDRLYSVIECPREQFAHPLHSMLVPWHRIDLVVEKSGHWLLDGAIAQPYRQTPGEPTDEAALDKTLGIDHQIVVGGLQIPAKRAELSTAQCLGEVLAPAPESHRDHSLHSRMPGRHLDKIFLHDPVKLQASVGP